MMMDLVPHPPTPAAVVHYFPDFGDFGDSETPIYNRRRSKSLLCCVVVFSFVETGLIVLLLLLLQPPPASSSSCQLWGCYPQKKEFKRAANWNKDPFYSRALNSHAN